jgi:aminomethyltransferase
MSTHLATPIPPELTLAAAVRASPFHASARRAGCEAFGIVNGLQVPLRFADPAEEYRRRATGVVLCDASAERHVEVRGPDACAFMRWLCATDLGDLAVGRCAPALLVDEQGGVVGDPMVLRLAGDRYWLAQESPGLAPWVKGVSLNCGLDVQVAAPELATLALEGPRSREVVDRLMGPDVAPLGEHEARELELGGLPLVLSPRRCGSLSAFSLRLRDPSAAGALWQRAAEAGRAASIAPAVLSPVHRIEAGRARVGAEMDADSDPFELGVADLVHLGKHRTFIGQAALAALAARGLRRRLVGVSMQDAPASAIGTAGWRALLDGGEAVGELRSSVFSPRFGRGIGLAMVLLSYAEPGTVLQVEAPETAWRCRVERLPFA